MKLRKHISILFMFLWCLTKVDYILPQNVYGWERIFNSGYGINGFYSQKLNSTDSKLWIVRPVGDFFGAGNYNYIRYNENTNSWYPVANNMLRAIHQQGVIGGNPFNYYTFPIVHAISPMDTNFILLNMNETNPYNLFGVKFYYSYNNGITKNEITAFYGNRFQGLAITPRNDSINYFAYNNVIFKSINRGISWLPVDTIPSFVGFLSVNPSNPDYVYGVDDSLFLSTDAGNNFNIVFSKRFSQLFFSYSETSILATNRNKLYKSIDNGINWNIVDSLRDSINYLEVDPDNEDILYAGTNTGLYKSDLGGHAFYLYNNSFSPSKNIIGLNKNPNRNFIYVVTEEAVYKCWNNYLINIEKLSNITPEFFYLYQNYPNPFNPLTKIKFDIMSNAGYPLGQQEMQSGSTANVKLTVYDMLGKEVETLVNQELNPGSYGVEWNPKNFDSGIYFYKLITENFVQVKKMIFIK